MLGVLLERASGQPLEAFLRARLFEPLGMVDTSFSVPPEKQARLTTAYIPDRETGALEVLDPPTAGWWSEPPAMANAAGMLVSTIDDLWAFVATAPGRWRGTRASSCCRRGRWRSHDARPPDGRPAGHGGPLPRAQHGWGYGMAAPRPLSGAPPMPWGFGWNGGTGTAWSSDPARGLTGILLTQPGHDLARAATALRGVLGLRPTAHALAD